MNQTATTFPLGTIVATANALASVPVLDILVALDRHATCDWGELAEEERLANQEALAEGERLLSAYSTSGGTRFWVITERDRSATTVLLLGDY